MFEVFFDNNNYSNLINSIIKSKLLKYFFSDIKFIYDNSYLDYVIIKEKEKDIFLENLENKYINNILQKYSYKNIINN